MEIITGVIMVFSLMGTVFAKYMTAKLMIRVRENVNSSEAQLRSIRGQLKTLEAENAIVQRKERTLNKHKERLETRIKNHAQELKKFSKK